MENLLICKVLTTRSYMRFTIMEITQKTWRLYAKVQIEKLSDNTFKFCFGTKRDRDYVFKSRPWSLNGALLILKEWPEYEGI